MIYKVSPKYLHIRSFLDAVVKEEVEPLEVICDNRNRVYTAKYENQTYVIKSFKRPHFINRIAYRHLRASKAKRSYLHSERIGEKLSPQPVAYIEEASLFMLNKSYYVSEYFKHDYTMQNVLSDKLLENREIILKQFAKFTFLLHERGILHADYSRGNILIRDENTLTYNFRLIDTNRMCFRKPNTEERLKSFVRLGPDNQDLETIIQEYAVEAGLSQKDSLAQAILYRDKFDKKWSLLKTLRYKKG